MPLVQINAIRELLEDAKARLAALTGQIVPGPPPPSWNRCKADIDEAIGDLGRLEEARAKIRADAAGVPDP